MFLRDSDLESALQQIKDNTQQDLWLMRIINCIQGVRNSGFYIEIMLIFRSKFLFKFSFTFLVLKTPQYYQRVPELLLRDFSPEIVVPMNFIEHSRLHNIKLSSYFGKLKPVLEILPTNIGTPCI